MIELAPNHKRGLGLANPLMNASGVLGFGRESRGAINLSSLGAFVTNALTATARTPAHPPNAVQLPNGVLIHTGLPNPGVSAALRRHAPEWQRFGPAVIVHLAATGLDDVRRSVAKIERVEAVSALELGLRDDVSAFETGQLVRAAGGSLPLLVRLPVERAGELCGVAAEAGADALTIGAPPRGEVVIGGRTISGRLYSPDNFPVALASVGQVVATLRAVDVPIIGAGGIYSLEAAQQMLAAGAAAIQLDGVLWREPDILACFKALAVT